MRSLANRLVKVIERKPASASLVGTVLVLGIDYVTGKHIEFPVLYALPVGLAAWGGRRRLAIVLTVLLPLVRVAFHIPWRETQALGLVWANAPVTSLALLIYALLIARTARQTKALRDEVHALEGILPICASCKKIRTESGVYEPVEKYVSEHSEATFTHGLCPACTAKLYPDFHRPHQEP